MSIDKDNFYKEITKKYSDYKIKNPKTTVKEVCFPKKYVLQPHQLLSPAIINPKTNFKGILLYYGIGAGKTCASIRIAEGWLGKGYKILVIVPASLKENYRNELRSQCTGEKYLSNEDRKQFPLSKEVIEESDEKIDKYYTIYSYNKFIELINENKLSLKKTILIIDEVQNLVSEHGSYYKSFYSFIKKAPESARIVLLSATPIFDKPVEIALTLNLLPLPKLLPIGNEFYNTFIDSNGDVKNMDMFKKYVKGFVSYYRGAPPATYPKKELNYVKCRMSDFQYKSYLTALENLSDSEKKTRLQPFKEGDIDSLPATFFLGLRMVSNITYPNKKIGEDGFKSFTGNHLNLDHLKNYSVKFYKIMKKIQKCEGTVFVYSGFKGHGGLKPFIKVLEANGYKNYKDYGEGKKRFAIWSGDEVGSYRDKFRQTFNHINNKDGSKIKIILGSPAVKEGVSFYRVRQAHILEPYWNMSRLEQVIGRTVRFCSHKDVPVADRIVEVYIYIAVHDDDSDTIDTRIMDMALKKSKINEPFERALKESAIDCELNKEANNFKGESPIRCEK